MLSFIWGRTPEMTNELKKKVLNLEQTLAKISGET